MPVRRFARWAREHQDTLAVLLIVFAAILPRAALMFRLPVFYVVGSRPYYATALQVAAGVDVTALSLRHTPGYPMFLVGIIGLFGVDPEAIAAVQHALGIGSAVICYYVGKLAAGRLVGLAAGLLAGLNTTLMVYEQHILTEPLFSFLILLSMLLLVAATRGRVGWLFLLGGVVAGLAALTRPIGQTIVLAAPPALWLLYRRWRPTARACLLLVAGFGLAAGPWIARNALMQSEAGVRHPGSTLLGHVRQEREYTRGYFTLDGGTDPDPVRQEARRVIERMAPSDPDPLEMWTELQQRLGISPAQANRLMGEIAVDTILRHPWHYLRVFSGATLGLFAGPKDERLEDFLPRTRNQWPGRFLTGPIKDGSVPDLNPSEPQLAQKWEAPKAAAVADLFRPDQAAPLLAALFLVGVAEAVRRPDRRALLIPALAVLGIIVLNGVIAGDKPRYRYPLDPAIGLVAIAGAGALVELATGAARRGLASLRSRQVRADAGPALGEQTAPAPLNPEGA